MTTGEMRPSLHGDVIHSRPIAINYGTDASPKVVVFYAGNDGVLRAINGNRYDTASAAVPRRGGDLGIHAAGVLPPDQAAARQHDDDQLPGLDRDAPTPLPKPYGMDGAITTYHNDNTSVFAGMRRGGRALYAFDVTGIAAHSPAAPTLLWKRGCPNLANDTDCSSRIRWHGADLVGREGAQGLGLSVSGTESPW